MFFLIWDGEVYENIIDGDNEMKNFFTEWSVLLDELKHLDVYDCCELKNGHFYLNNDTDNIQLHLVELCKIIPHELEIVESIYNFTWKTFFINITELFSYSDNLVKYKNTKYHENNHELLEAIFTH